MKLEQGQVWKQGDAYIRIVHLVRLHVGYKIMSDIETREGAHHQASKKEFCRLLKGATLMSGEDARPGINERTPVAR